MDFRSTTQLEIFNEENSEHFYSHFQAIMMFMRSRAYAEHFENERSETSPR
jgi:hypothetical protein